MRRLTWMLLLIATIALTGTARAQGVDLRSGATVLAGSARNCSKPATVDYDEVRKVTPEWRKIKSEGIRKGSARYDLLIAQMNARIKRLCRKIADDEGRDCVVSAGDIADDKGLEVADLTDAVTEAVESGG